MSGYRKATIMRRQALTIGMWLRSEDMDPAKHEMKALSGVARDHRQVGIDEKKLSLASG
jgi:hypothetical protein